MFPSKRVPPRLLASYAHAASGDDDGVVAGLLHCGAEGAAGATNVSGGVGLDTGVWPSALYATSLVLQISGNVYGGGGVGGLGSDTITPSAVGGAGGDAINCRAPITIVVNSGGSVKSGGGGGGGGGTWRRDLSGEPTTWNGGGGGGGFPNGPGGLAGQNADINVASAGAPGTSANGGAGGAGGSTGVSTRVTGAGGAGGNAGASGGAGAGPAGSGGLGTWTAFAAAAGGAPGFAVRKNGNAVPVTNNGTIVGTKG